MATITRCRCAAPTARWWPKEIASGCVSTATRSGSPSTGGSGKRSGSALTRCITWPCWSENRGRWILPVPLEGWELPECPRVLRRRLEADHGSEGTKEYIGVLRLLEKHSLARLKAAQQLGCPRKETYRAVSLRRRPGVRHLPARGARTSQRGQRGPHRPGRSHGPARGGKEVVA